MVLQISDELLLDIGAYIDERYTPGYDIPASFGAMQDVGCECTPMPMETPRHVEGPVHSVPTAPVVMAPEEEPPSGLLARFKRKFAPAASIDDLLARRDATFSEALLHEIDSRHLSDPEVYKRANIDRKLFSKIRGNAQYQPKKSTAVALALALCMNLDDTLDLIGRAGYTLTTSNKADIIVMYFIEHECWDLGLINEVLYKFGEPLVGC